MLKYTSVLICILICLQITSAAQINDSVRLKFLRQISLRHNILPSNDGLINRFSVEQNRSLVREQISRNDMVRQDRIARPIRSVNKPNNVNATCFDTSLRLTYGIPGKSYMPGDLTKTRDGNIVSCGFNLDTLSYKFDAHLLKFNQQGDTIWSKVIRGGYPKGLVDIYKVFELSDNSLLLAGDVELPYPAYNSRANLMLIRVSATGDLIWQKTFKSRLWDADTTRGMVDILDCKQDAAGDIYLCGDIRLPFTPFYPLAFKMDLSGNIIWSNVATGLAFPTLCGINFTGNNITFFGRTYPGQIASSVSAFVMNKNTGDTIQTKALTPVSPDYLHHFFPTAMIKHNNGNLLIFGRGVSDEYQIDGETYNTNFGYIEVTPNFDFVQSWILQSPYSANGYQTVGTMFSDGSGAFSRLGWTSDMKLRLLYGSFENNELVKERFLPHPAELYSYISNFLQTDDGGQLVSNAVIDSVNNARAYTELVRLHNSDTAGSCLGTNTQQTLLKSQGFYKTTLPIDSMLRNILTEDPRPFEGIFNEKVSIQSNCKQISFCDSLRLSVPQDTVCAGTPVNITIHKNRECGAYPAWYYDTAAVSSFVQLNDSMVSATVNKSWQGKIVASIAGCRPLRDSITLTVLQAPEILTLGPDTTLCPSNTIFLNAHAGYASYKWQNGTTDSLFTVTQPGRYYVTVTNACGDVLSDTIVISPQTAAPFDIGPNRQACAGDTITITAPAGFNSFQWSGSNILSNSLPQITAVPTASGWYSVTAQQTPGCFVADSLFVTVQQVPAIRLGADTSICIGQQLILNAGPGFSSYQWSTGQQQQQITVTQAGTYSIKATLNGCSAYDTLKLPNVYPLPVAGLGPDVTLCAGRQLQLSPGQPQAAYLWSTGSTSAIISIGQSGTYWLRITSAQSCINTDTIKVSFVAAPLPALGADTTLCQGQTLTLNAASPGANTYQWQDGSTAPTYTVNSAGTYRVTAGTGQCTAADTITIAYTVPPLFTLGRDTFICTGQQLQLTPVLNTTASFLWQDGSTASAYTVTQPGLYSLTATNSCGSRADSITIDQGTCFIQMPTAFTPNGDGVNDVFKLKYPFPMQQYTLSIYNRYGQLIFQTSNPTQGWNGTFKGKLQPQNSFVWTIQYKAINNRTQLLKGMVTLIR